MFKYVVAIVAHWVLITGAVVLGVAMNPETMGYLLGAATLLAAWLTSILEELGGGNQ